jgi:hypothetical protein
VPSRALEVCLLVILPENAQVAANGLGIRFSGLGLEMGPFAE